MTTVAYDGEFLASDRQATIGTRKIVEPVPKIKRIKYNGEPAIAGLAGNIDFGHTIIQWLDDGCDDEEPDFEDDEQNTSVMVIQGGNVFMFNSSGLHQNYGKVKWAMGSGGEYAIGAMEHGASAREAVEIASRIDIFSGYGVDILKENGDV